MLFVNEVFRSIQGEASYSGCKTTFVRMSGCNLRCDYCDTTYAQEQGVNDDGFTSQELLTYLIDHKFLSPHVSSVCITGGEPLLQPHEELKFLVSQILSRRTHVCIETNGSVKLPSPLWNCSFIVDYKLPSSGSERKSTIHNIQSLRHFDVVKFVVGTEGDWERALEVCESLENYFRNRQGPTIYVQPTLTGTNLSEIRDRGLWLVDKILASEANVRFSLQIHKLLWGNRPGI